MERSVVGTEDAVVASQGDKIRHLSQKKKKVAIEEEEFTEALTTIIRRDFFPDVARLQAQVELLDSSNNVGGSVLSEERTADEGNLGNDTPQMCKGSQKDADTLGLDKFLNKYESEDDASFSDMLEKSREVHQQKHAWLSHKEEEYSLMGVDKPAITDGREVQRRAGLDSWKYTAKNSLMYVPDSADFSASEMIDRAAKTQQIAHPNTRLPRHFVQKVVLPDNQKKPTQDKIGVDGKIVSDDKSPKVNGYGFIATPRIVPGVDASPLMTWGSVEGTPQRLDTEVVPPPGPSFKMPKIPAREKMAIKLADEVAKASRQRKKIVAATASPSLLRERLGTTPSKSDRLRLLSPAARKLIGQKTRLSSDPALNAIYSPQLSVRSSGIRTPDIRSKRTPVHTSTTSLTDDLLNLKKN